MEATVAHIVDDDIAQASDSEEESDGGDTECEYCFTPMEGRVGEVVQCPNCELCYKVLRRAWVDESSEASSEASSAMLGALEVIATASDDHEKGTKTDQMEPRKICALNTQCVFHDGMERHPCNAVEARGIETEDVISETYARHGWRSPGTNKCGSRGKIELINVEAAIKSDL